MTVRTCICNVFGCDIHYKVYTYLLNLCYMRSKLRCFIACSHRFLLSKSAFPWIGHPANLFQLCPRCLSSFCIKIDQYEDSINDEISSFMIFQFPPKRRQKKRRYVTATTTLHSEANQPTAKQLSETKQTTANQQSVGWFQRSASDKHAKN